MIAVQWKASQAAWYQLWEATAEAETQTAIASKQNGNAYDFDSSIWTELKDHLASLFNNKCAYCESKIRHVMPGDVEHFRPKSKVTECPDHPGYYWLAYRPGNLLLSCELCNRAGGKMNQFPVNDNRWCQQPTDPHIESPLLINPYIDQPQDHISFTPAAGNTPVGTIRGMTPRGRETIRVCKLDRPELDEQRRAAQRAAIDRLGIAVITGKIAELRDELQSGQTEYSASILAVAEGWIENISQQWVHE